MPALKTARSPTGSNFAKKDFPDVGVYTDAYDAINDAEVDVVVITSTNATHFLFGRDALLAGKYVIVEKPFTVTYAEAAELVELAKKTDRQLAVYHSTLQVINGTEIKTLDCELSRGGYQHLYENVLQLTLGQSQLAVCPEQVVLVVRLIEMCRKSAVERRTVEVDF
ncbi:hypothetical protein BJY00DRAFT_316397 [Aspergillus carlsbadensis]|nr:hypothetical protein BJY00DRAFT_316397 [Aspergillus carlsbadensis]